MKKNNDLKIVGFPHNGCSAVPGNLVQFFTAKSRCQLPENWKTSLQRSGQHLHCGLINTQSAKLNDNLFLHVNLHPNVSKFSVSFLP